MRNLRRLYFKNRKGRRNCFASRSVRKLEGKYNDTPAVSWYHIFTMNDDVIKDQLPQNPNQNRIMPEPESPVGSSNKEIQRLASEETQVRVTAVEQGIEVSQELQEHGVKATGHDRVDLRLEGELEGVERTVSSQVAKGSEEPPFKLPLPPAEAFLTQRKGDRGSSMFGSALTTIKAIMKWRMWRIKSKSPLQKPI